MHINMTTPVLREVYHGPGPTCESTFISHFMIPYGNQNDIKIPTDPDVYIRDMPEMKVFVRYVEKYVSNIPTSPAYGVFISQLIRYARACSSYGCFILRATRLSNKLLEQGYVNERLKSPLRKLYGRYGYLIKQYEVSLSQMLNGILWPNHIQWQPPTDQTLYRTRPLTEFWVVSIEHLGRGVWHADRGRLLLRTPGPVPFGACICSTCWDQSFFRTCRYFSGLCSSNIPRYFLDFAYGIEYIITLTVKVIRSVWSLKHHQCSLWYIL